MLVSLITLRTHMYTPSLQEVQAFTAVAEVEKFVLEHGEQIVELLGSEVDRIEARIKASVQGCCKHVLPLRPLLFCHCHYRNNHQK